MSFILSLDEGTTSARALVLDREGKVRAVGQQSFEQRFPQPGWVEHDPLAIWEAQVQAVRQALSGERIGRGEIAAIGIANQRETTLLWDRKTGCPVHHAIVWQDRRTAGICERLRAGGCEPELQARTGLLIDPYFSATKIAWLLDHVPGLRPRARSGELAFGTVDTYLIWRLTGGNLHVTDPGNASRTALYNIHTLAWDEHLLAMFEIPAGLLPEVRPSSGILGEVSAVPELNGIPIAGVAGDQQAALFGQLCLSPGLTKNTYGTGCFALQNTGQTPMRSHSRLLTTVGWERAGTVSYALEGSVFVAGAVVQWLRDGLGLIRSAEEVESLAGSVPDSGGVYLVPAFAGLGAPHWDPRARGTVVGLTRGTTAGHLARAALEGIAHQVADLLEAMQADAGFPCAELCVDGGASRNDLLMQTQADLLGVPVVRPAVTEATALGASFLAGLAVGFWRDTGEIAQHRQIDRRFEPGAPGGQVAARRAGWKAALQRSLAWDKEAP